MKNYSIAALFLVLCTAALFFLSAFASIPQSPKTNHYKLQVEELATGLNHPWSLAFLPDGRMLVTERPGRLLIISKDGLELAEVTGLPPIAASGQGGMLDVTLHPHFSQNKLIYFPSQPQGMEGSEQKSPGRN